MRLLGTGGLPGVIDEGVPRAAPRSGCELVRRQPPVVAEMPHPGAGKDRCRVGDQAPVAAPPQRLRAHDRSHLVRCFADHPGEGLAERLGGHVVGVGAEGGMAKSHIWRGRRGLAEPAEAWLPAVADPGGKQLLRQLSPAKLRETAAAGRAAHIDDKLHTGAAEQPGKLVTAGRAVPDREQTLARAPARRFCRMRAAGRYFPHRVSLLRAAGKLQPRCRTMSHQARTQRHGMGAGTRPLPLGVSLVPGPSPVGPGRSPAPRAAVPGGTGRTAACEDCPHAGTRPVRGPHARVDKRPNSFYIYISNNYLRRLS